MTNVLFVLGSSPLLSSLPDSPLHSFHPFLLSTFSNILLFYLLSSLFDLPHLFSILDFICFLFSSVSWLLFSLSVTHPSLSRFLLSRILCLVCPLFLPLFQLCLTPSVYLPPAALTHTNSSTAIIPRLMWEKPHYILYMDFHDDGAGFRWWDYPWKHRIDFWTIINMMRSHGNSCRKALPRQRRANQCGTAATENLTDSSLMKKQTLCGQIWVTVCISCSISTERNYKTHSLLHISFCLPSMIFIAFLFTFFLSSVTHWSQMI